MATHRLPLDILSGNLSSGVFRTLVKTQLSLASAPGNEICVVMSDPAGGGDAGVYGSFSVPKNYVGSPVLVIRGILDGAPTNALPFGAQMKPLANSEAYDAALGTEDTASNSTWTGYADEDVYEETITLSNVTLAVDDDVDFFFYWDDSVGSPWSGNFLLTRLALQYSDS